MGLVKVSILSNNCAIHIDTRLAWIMSHKIATMYKEPKHQETLQASLAIQNLKYPTSFLPPQPYQLMQPSLPGKLQEVPSGIQDIQPRP